MTAFTEFGDNLTSNAVSFSSSEFDKNVAAHIFAKHFESANCTSSMNAYQGDFMRQVSSVCITSSLSNSVTYLSNINAALSSSVYSADVALSNEALKLTYALEEVGRHREAAREVMKSIEDNLHATSLSVANAILADADVRKLSSRSLIGLIRASSRAREALPAWNSAYKRSWIEAKRKNKNPEALFVGLPRPSEI